MKNAVLAFFLVLLPLQGCLKERAVEHAFFNGGEFSVPVPPGYLPIAENRDLIAAMLGRAGAPGEAVTAILAAPSGAYFNPETISMANYSGRKVEKPCGEIYGVLKQANGGAGETVTLGGAEWLMFQGGENRVLECHSCSGGLLVSAVYTDPAGAINDLKGFAAANLSGLKVR